MTLLRRLLARRDRRPLFVAVSLLALTYFLAYPFVDAWLRSIGVASQFEYWDFGAYGSALDRWDAGETIYERNDDGGYHGTFLYPPVALLLFEPFVALFEYPQNRVAWVAFSTLLLVIGIQLVVGEFTDEIRWWERGVLAWATLGFQPLLLSMKMGQTAGFTGALLCFSYVFLSRQDAPGRYAAYAAGAFTGAVGFFKLAYAPVGAHLLADRRRLLGAVGAGLALAVVSVAVFGPDAHLTYLRVLAWGVGADSSARSPAYWLAPYYKPLYWIPGALYLRIGASAVVAVLAARSESADRTVFALGLAAFPLLTPLAYTYYLVALLPAGLVLLAGELRRDGAPLVPVLALWLANVHAFGLKFVVDVLPSIVPASSALEPLYPVLQPGLWAALLLFGLAFLRVAEAVPSPPWLDRLTPRTFTR